MVRARLPGQPRIGIGNTRFGAQVAAVVGRGRLEKIDRGDATVEAAYLAPLSIRLLPADDDTRERLRVFGLTRIGEFAALPASAVVARFGAHGELLHKLARGMDGTAAAAQETDPAPARRSGARATGGHARSVALHAPQPVWRAV